jgi:hypothetical protein
MNPFRYFSRTPWGIGPSQCLHIHKTTEHRKNAI